MNNQMQNGGNGMNMNNPMMMTCNGMNMNNPMMIGGNGMNMNNPMMTGCFGGMNNPMMMTFFGGMNNPMMMGGNGGMNNPKKEGNNGDIDMDEQDKMMLSYLCFLMKNPNMAKNMGMKIEDIKSKIAFLGYKYGKREAEKKEKEKNKNKNEPKKEDNKAEDDVKEYTIKFKKGDKITDIKIDKEEMVAELLNQYFEKEKVKNGTFTFKGRTLTTNDPESLTEAGLKNGDEITVT
jgi:hypothetical protein